MNAVAAVFSARELLWNFTLRELRSKYRRSFLGWAWSMLNPAAMVATYWFVFGVVFPRTDPPLGDPSDLQSYALFLICGLIPWNFFALTSGLGLGSISSNAGLVRRVAFPREILVFANVLHACVQFAIELTLLTAIFVIVGSPVLPWLPLILLTAVLLAIFSAGFALALSALSVYFRDMGYLWAIGIQVWFFATPILYPPSYVSEHEDIPGWLVTLLQANPMAGFVRVFRRLFYDGGAPGAITYLGVTATAFVSLALGWMIFARLAPRFAEEV
jgi:ABC-2 type transport system permease protein